MWIQIVIYVQPLSSKVTNPIFCCIAIDQATTWWRHQMETFSALLAICAGNSPVSGEFLAQRPVTRSFDVFFDVRLIKRLNKHSRGWWFETLSHPLWRHRNEPDRIRSYNVKAMYCMSMITVHNASMHVNTSSKSVTECNKWASD